ncbi:hypothetical protein JCM8547_009040 [Rhodosporidiobolus lusitaniae]
MATTDDRAFWVCGQETYERCSGCGAHGQDVLFCSREHQRLGWKHHKRICGENSSPFFFPPCDEAELELLSRAVATNVPSRWGTKWETLPQSFETLLEVPKEDFDKVVPAALSSPSKTGRVVDVNLQSITRHVMLYTLFPGEKDWPEIFRQLNPFFGVAFFENLVFSLFPFLPDNLRISSQARHRALVLFSLVKSAVTEEPPRAFDKAFHNYSLSRFVNELTRNKPFPYPLTVMDFLQTFSVVFGKIFKFTEVYTMDHTTNLSRPFITSSLVCLTPPPRAE